MNRPLRILNLIRTLNPEHGGPAEGLRQSVVATRALGHEEEVLSLDTPGAPWLAAFPAPAHAVGPAQGVYGYTPRLLPWLQAHGAQYDALVVHGLWQYLGLATRQALAGTGQPYFVYTHGMLDPWFKRRYPLKHAKKWLYWPWGEYRVLRDAAAVLFTTEEESRLAAQTFWLYRARHEVLGYGLELDEQARHARAEDFLSCFPALRGRRLLLFLGRIHPKKGCDLLIEAFAAVVDEDPQLHLVMAGPDQVGLQPTLQALAQRLGVGHRVTWTGMLQGAPKWGALRAAEAFVLPSHQENFGVAVAEALAMGVPALLSTQVNIWREVVDAGAGLAEPDTVAGTTALLSRWLALPGAAQAAMRQAAPGCYERHFHIRAAAQRLVSLVQRHARPPPRAQGFGDETKPFLSADSQPCNTGRPQ